MIIDPPTHSGRATIFEPRGVCINAHTRTAVTCQARIPFNASQVAHRLRTDLVESAFCERNIPGASWYIGSEHTGDFVGSAIILPHTHQIAHILVYAYTKRTNDTCLKIGDYATRRHPARPVVRMSRAGLVLQIHGSKTEQIFPRQVIDDGCPSSSCKTEVSRAGGSEGRYLGEDHRW